MGDGFEDIACQIADISNVESEGRVIFIIAVKRYLRQARADALEEAAATCEAIMPALDDIDCVQFDEYGILGRQFIGAEKCIEAIRALKDKPE